MKRLHSLPSRYSAPDLGTARTDSSRELAVAVGSFVGTLLCRKTAPVTAIVD
jgi:hypothetical protein